MTERIWRLTLGISILTFLSFDLHLLLYGLIGIMFFEGITNIRTTKIVSRLRYGEDYINIMRKDIRCIKSSRAFQFEAERMLRFAMASAMLVTFVIYPIWFFPWFIGLMLTSAGLTSICPMLMVFQWLGFKG
ncbi:MAG: DUF2892 domain-containing protein [Methylococcales bacterium]|jgi:hypothetical protein|nr:DUF2892 domain-containing protein [Methylococcales bacterium]MBT7408710.1 DUF2892 domain-containing protein [Methylococcales bacterium]